MGFLVKTMLVYLPEVRRSDVFATGEKVDWKILNLGGAAKNSANYRMADSCTWEVVEKSTSTNYAVQSGFINESLSVSQVQTFYIKGYVKTSDGNGLSGVIVNLSGNGTGSYTTDSTGYYEFTGLTSGNYTMMPSKSEYAFNPQKRIYSTLVENQNNQDFTALSVSVGEGQVKIGRNFFNPKTGQTTSIFCNLSSPQAHVGTHLNYPSYNLIKGTFHSH